MTTYTLTGIAVQFTNDQVQSIVETQLSLAMAPGESVFTGTIVGTLDDGTAAYDVDLDDYYTTLDGVSVDGPGFDEVDLQLQRITNGNTSLDALLLFDNNTNTAHLFQLSGDAIPASALASNAAFQSFVDGSTIADVASGTSYDLAAVPDVGVTENDFIGVDDDNDFIDGGIGNDTILGDNNNDTLIGGPGDDALNGNGGDDAIIPGGNIYGDYIAGSTGSDTITFTGAEGADYYTLGYYNLGAITVNINGAANTGSVTKTSGTDTLVDVRDPMTAPDGGLNIQTDTANDTFNVSSGNGGWVSLDGGQGNDTFNLTLDGTVRLDYIGASGGITADLAAGTIADGQGGTDTVNVLGGAAALQLRGSNFADDITGSARDETFILRGGKDTLDGGAGTDLLRYDRNGVESVNANLATGTATAIWNGISSTDTISNIENLRGSREGNDMLTGNDVANSLRGMGGNDTLTGGLGDDTLEGGAGSDTAVLGVALADATVTAISGGFQVVSAEGTDILESIEFVQFADALVAAGNLIGATPGDTVIGTDGDDTLTGTTGDDVIAGGGGSDSLDGGDGNDNISGSDGNDSIDGGTGNDSLGGGFGDDILTGSAGNDVIGGGMGDDLVLGNDGNDLLAGGAGDDTLFGGDGNDNIGASFGNDSVDGNGGNDSLGGGTGRDTIDGGAGNDNIGGGEGDDVVNGGTGDDFLAGGGRNDVIDGGAGDDQINAGDGDDTVTGGAGDDQFVFNGFNDGDADVFTDWTNGEDTFRMTGVENAPGSGLQGYLDALNLTTTAEGVQMSYEGHVITLLGADLADLGLEDFTFL